MNPVAKKGAARFGLGNLTGRIYFSSVAEAERAVSVRGQLHHMQRAFEAMQLDGILCVDGYPAVYFRDFDEPLTREEANDLHKSCWNQGVGTVLVLQDPHQVYIFSALVRPSNDSTEPLREHQALVEILNRSADVLEAHQLVRNIASGHYYREQRAKFFDSSHTVDQFLVKMLGRLCDHLNKGGNRQSMRHVHSFLGRLIFTCYLVDRGIIRLSEYPFIGRTGVDSVADLFDCNPLEYALSILFDRLFPVLKREFNGSTFEGDLDQERRLIQEPQAEVLRRFFRGEDLDSLQQGLGFWAFDFSVIPVETISAIYEKFLEREDAAGKEAKGAFYTPRHLAEMVVAEAIEGHETLLDKRFLDPCCGSGVFLVIIFNRLAEEWQLEHRHASSHEKIRGLLALFERLQGIDVDETACRIACFSLYIAFLDHFDPPTLRALKAEAGLGTRKPLLPPLLAYKKDGYKTPSTGTVLEGGFFDSDLPLGGGFDFIVGNPPWVSRQAAGENVARWLAEQNTAVVAKTAHGQAAQSKRVLLPQDQIAIAFLWKVPTHLTAAGTGCLLLPSQILLNRTDDFQRAWFSRHTANRIVHLADFRRFLFENAIRPCFILRFNRQPPVSRSRIEYITPKVMRADPRSGRIPLLAQDRKFIRLNELLDAAQQGQAAILWKTRLWGTQRDLKLLDALLAYTTLDAHAGEPGEGKRWLKGQGFQPWYQACFDMSPQTYGEPRPIPGTLQDRFIRTSDVPDLLLSHRDCIGLEQRLREVRCKTASPSTVEADRTASLAGFRRSPDGTLFEPPLLLVNKGFSRFAFADFKVLYQHALTGIHGPPKDRDLLLFLTVYLRSRLAAYFQFHTAGALGTERDEVRVHELLRLPCPLPDSDEAVPEAWRIVHKVAIEVENTRQAMERTYAEEEAREALLFAQSTTEIRRNLVDQLQRKLEPLVYQYFGLSEDDIALVEDTCNVFSVSATPFSPSADIKTLHLTTEPDRQRFAEWLCRTLNRWTGTGKSPRTKSKFYFVAEHGVLPRAGLCVVTLRRARKELPPKPVADNSRLEHALARVADASRQSAGAFQYLRGIVHATPEAIYIVRPDLLGQWTRTAALNAAEGIFGAIAVATDFTAPK